MEQNIHIKEAQTALEELEVVEEKAKNLILADFVAFPLMLWGNLWFIQYFLGYAYTAWNFQLAGRHPDQLAGWLTAFGLCLTFGFILLKLRYGNPIRSSGTWFERFRAPLLTVVWFLYSFVSSTLHTFESGRATNAFYVSYWMLLYIVYGFWFASGLLITVGVLISAFAIVGYYFLEGYYSLWMAVLGGGTLFAGGLYAKLKYRTKRGGFSG